MGSGPTSVDVVANWLFSFAEAWPFVGTLMGLMIADVVLGVVAAYGLKKINSTASFAGMCKKSVTLIVVGVCAILGRLANMPLSEMAAGGYCITELLSITEKAAMCGVKFPVWVIDVLEKVRASRVPDPTLSAPSVRVVHADQVNVSRSAKIAAPPMTGPASEPAKES